MSILYQHLKAGESQTADEEKRRSKGCGKTNLIDLAYRKKKTCVCIREESEDLKLRKTSAINDNQNSSMTKQPLPGAQPMISNEKCY